MYLLTPLLTVLKGDHINAKRVEQKFVTVRTPVVLVSSIETRGARYHPRSPPNLNDTHLNSYFVSSHPLEIGPELTTDYPLICRSAREYAGALVRLVFEWRSRYSEITIISVIKQRWQTGVAISDYPHSDYLLCSLKSISDYRGGNLKLISNYPSAVHIIPYSHVGPTYVSSMRYSRMRD